MKLNERSRRVEISEFCQEEGEIGVRIYDNGLQIEARGSYGGGKVRLEVSGIAVLIDALHAVGLPDSLDK